VRNAVFRWVQLLAEGAEEDMRELARAPPSRGSLDKAWTAEQLYAAIEPYWETHSQIIVAHEARAPDLFLLEDVEEEAQGGAEDGGGGAPLAESGFWKVTQKIMDPAGDLDWVLEGEVDLAASDEEGRAVVRLVEIRQEGVIRAEKTAAAETPNENDMWAVYEDEAEEEEEEEEAPT
jgi:hypothetical protein